MFKNFTQKYSCNNAEPFFNLLMQLFFTNQCQTWIEVLSSNRITLFMISFHIKGRLKNTCLPTSLYYVYICQGNKEIF